MLNRTETRAFLLLLLAVSGATLAGLGWLIESPQVLVSGVAGLAIGWFLFDKELGP